MYRVRTIRNYGLYLVLLAVCMMWYLHNLLVMRDTSIKPMALSRHVLSVSGNATTLVAKPPARESSTSTSSPDLPTLERTGCFLETLDPWDKSLAPFIDRSPSTQFNCSNSHQLMFVDEYGVLRFNDTALKLYHIDKTYLRCRTKPLIRMADDENVRFGAGRIVSIPTFVKSHFFRVTCSRGITSVVYDYLHFNPFWNTHAKPKQMISDEGPSRLSLVVFGIDSVSRSHAIRYLPKSYKFLLEEFQAYDFEGYSRVGENTWPNLVPLLTGKSHRSFSMVEKGKSLADTIPFIWTEEPMEHMATMFSEDYPDLSTFNFNKRGFYRQPTDYYFRPYTLGMKHFRPKIIQDMKEPDDNCYGVNSHFDIQIKYLKGFLSRYRGKRKFALVLNNQLSHDRFATLSQGDESYLELLHWMKDTDQIKHTVFLTMSDHGLRIGHASATSAGRKEKNRPWFMLHVPKYLLQEYSWLHKTVLENSKKLVTHYDVYQTMLDIINDNAFMHRPEVDVQTHLVRRNIFFPIPSQRTCPDAGIEKPYCACEVRHTISVATDLVRAMAELLVSGLNELLSEQQKSCHTLLLFDVTEAEVTYAEHNTKHSMTKTHENPNSPIGRYFILFHTKPGNAHFEGTVDLTQDSLNISNQHMVMVGEPARLDRYGNQSYCVNDSLLKLYCYCKTLV